MVSTVQSTETHIAKPGDSWYKISKMTGKPVDELKKLNGTTSDTIAIGQPIKLKSSNNINYSVLPGDTLWAISQRTGIPVATLKKINGLTSDTLSVGQILKIPPLAQIEHPQQTTAPRPNYTTQQIQEKIKAQAKEAGVDENLALAVAEQESKFNSNAESKTGAAGIFQLTKATAQELGVKDRYNTDENISGGIKYLKWCIDKTSTEEEALVAYNRGLTTLKNAKAAGKEIDSITDKYITADGREIGYAKAVTEKKAKYEAQTN